MKDNLSSALIIKCPDGMNTSPSLSTAHIRTLDDEALDISARVWPHIWLPSGTFILIISAIMYWNSSNKKAIATNFDETLFIARKKLGIILSMFVGFISSIFGIGGGIIHVPVMIYALAFPPHMATATSHFVLAVSSFMGVTSHIFLNHIVWIPALAVGFGAVIGAQIGARLSKKTKPRSIILLLCISLFLLGIRMIVESNLLF